jgi:hypothetical protein
MSPLVAFLLGILTGIIATVLGIILFIAWGDRQQ